MDADPMMDVLMSRASAREYTDRMPSDETVETIVRAGQQAPFAAQLGSLLLRRDREKNPFHAPLLFTVCADVHRLELVLARRGWKRVTSDAAILLFAIQDAAYMAQNLVIAGEALGDSGVATSELLRSLPNALRRSMGFRSACSRSSNLRWAIR
jgi:nitroreductase